MSVAERVVLWNRWYEGISEEWRFQLVVWSLLILGAFNMLLTVAIGFPFALLVVLGIIAITAVRLPFVLGWITPSEGVQVDPSFHIEGAGWLVNLNLRYEAMPEPRRIWIYPAVLLIAGGINMMLTIAYGFPFGLLFLLALLALVLIRAPYTAGWLPHHAPAQPTGVSQEADPALGYDEARPPAEEPNNAHPSTGGAPSHEE